MQVTRAMVDRLGIAPKISKYSYQHNDSVFLEEDCDADIFVRAVEATGVKVVPVFHHTNHDSPIRSMRRFQP
jgi:hypothetical protein